MRATLLVLVALTGCMAVGPDYERPEVPLPRAMPEMAGAVSSETTVRFGEGQPWDQWWKVFDDPNLDRLIEETRAANFDVRAAIARVHAARAVVRQSFAPLLPSIGTTGQYTYQKFAPNAIVVQPTTGQPSAPGGPGGTGVSTFAFSGQPFQLWAGTGDLSYELDLWGRIRRGLEAAEAEEAATEEDKKSVELTQLGEVANAYFDLGQADADLAIANEAVLTRERSLELVKGRFDSGLAPELDLRRAEAELARARAEVPEAERRRGLAEHQLAILTGRMPDVHFAGRPPAAFDLPPEIPVGIPAALLERRPDVRAAELRAKSSNARIGEAIANFFPTITIAGRAGYASVDFSTITQPGGQLWSIGPSIRIPLFSGGQTYARMLETEALTDEAAARFYQTVLVAFREVADAILNISMHQRARDRQRENVTAEARALELATIEYEHGLVNYLVVLDAQRELLSARQALVQAQRQLLSDIVQLEKALGGGWTEVPADPWTPVKSGT